MIDFSFSRIFPGSYWADRTKLEWAYEQVYQYDFIFHQAIEHMFSEELKIALMEAIVKIDEIEIPHHKQEYPFSWSCII